MKRKKQKHEDINFWQSSTDMMTALLLILMLVILLLILYLMRIPERDYIDYFDAESVAEYTDSAAEPVLIEVEHDDDGGDGGGGGGGGGGDGDEDGEEEEEEEEPGEYPEDNGTKSAVFVRLVDEQTQKTVKQEGVRFDLHAHSGTLQILNTYYPTKVTYREFETTDDGTFYLPEKIPTGSYYLRNLSEATGYDKAENTDFELDQIYDWPDPYIVNVYIHPAKNVIRIQMTDKKKPISGGAFDVIAKSDIVTMDGTLRHKKGDIVDTIICDEKGYGESEELFLGEYTLKQTEIPEYYASIEKLPSVTLEKKTDENITQTLENEKTKIQITLKDELTETPIQGAEFTVSHGEEEEIYKTNSKGRINITDLEKDTKYTIKQISTQKDYIIAEDENVVQVSKKGRIGNETQTKIALSNRMIRVNLHVKNAVLQTPYNKNLTIKTNEDAFIRTWTGDGSFTDLVPADYKIYLGNNEKKAYMVTVRNMKEIQDIEISVWTVASYIALAGGIAGITAVVFFIIWLLRRRRRLEHK